MSVYEEAKKIFRSIFDDEEVEITMELSEADYEEWDSLIQLQLIVAFERKFNVEFATDEIKRLNSVGDFVKLVERKCK